ncbi:dienelactone hydrolase family protein [Salinarimonas sp.]|uniref:dienelactone hydrolase family protein n=1 Tax=Salinarimonas sp. TaxID=2766526 RepID=UPI0032D9485E
MADTETIRPAAPPIDINVEPMNLPGELALPAPGRGLVVFAHGSGSSRLSPRNRQVAEELRRAGFGTLLFDLLLSGEMANRENVFDINLLSERLVDTTHWVRTHSGLGDTPIGFFGASTGAAAALVAETRLPGAVRAVVSRGGRPDLAGIALEQVRAPTLLIVGGEDVEVLPLNQRALDALTCEKKMEIVPGATHLFEEKGALERVTDLAKGWFETHLVTR